MFGTHGTWLFWSFCGCFRWQFIILSRLLCINNLFYGHFSLFQQGTKCTYLWNVSIESSLTLNTFAKHKCMFKDIQQRSWYFQDISRYFYYKMWILLFQYVFIVHFICMPSRHYVWQTYCHARFTRNRML